MSETNFWEDVSDAVRGVGHAAVVGTLILGQELIDWKIASYGAAGPPTIDSICLWLVSFVNVVLLAGYLVKGLRWLLCEVIDLHVSYQEHFGHHDDDLSDDS